MRLKWLKLGVAAALIGTSAHAEWQFEYRGGEEEGGGWYTAYSSDAADWYDVIGDAKAISWEKIEPDGWSAGAVGWFILYLHPDGSVWHCNYTGLAKYSSCEVND